MTSNKRKTIYVVDDDETILNLLTRIVAAEGYVVRTFGAAGECIAAVAAQSPDCVVSDLQMPGMDGAQLIRELRRLGHAVPVIIVTAAIPPSIQLDQARRAGAFRILAKPPSRPEILRAIAEASGATGAGAADKWWDVQESNLRPTD